MGQCRTCGIEPGCQRPWKNMVAAYTSCVSWTPPPKTRGDTIREMTDEELVNFLRAHPWYGHGKVYADDELINWLSEPYTE